MAEHPAAPVTPEPAAGRADSQRWTLADIPYDRVPHGPAMPDGELFYVVAAASLMEAATDIYTHNLIEFFAEDAEVTGWLEQYWLPEELQHGRALRRYVETAWPDFDWEAAFGGFYPEFVKICEKDGLEAQRSLEMASRCVVEMGTASYYTTLSRASPEPVLAMLARHIVEDEVRHYKHFYRYYRKYRLVERPGRGAVWAALWRRLRMTGGADSFAAVKHLHQTRWPGARFEERDYRDARRRVRAAVGPYFPHPMSVKMLLRPLALGPRTTRLAVPVVTALARRFVP
jgi:hypothetical protein